MRFEIMSHAGHDNVLFKDGNLVSDDNGVMAKLDVTTEAGLIAKLFGEQKCAAFIRPADSKDPPLRVHSFKNVDPDAVVSVVTQLAGG